MIVIWLSCWWMWYCIDCHACDILAIPLKLQAQLNSNSLILSLCPTIYYIEEFIGHLWVEHMWQREHCRQDCAVARRASTLFLLTAKGHHFMQKLKKNLTHLGLSDSVVKVIGGEITINTFCTWSSAAFLNLCPPQHFLEAAHHLSHFRN